MVVAAESSPLTVSVAVGVVVLAPGGSGGYGAAGNAGEQISPVPGGAAGIREERQVFRRGWDVLTVVLGRRPGGGSSPEGYVCH